MSHFGVKNAKIGDGKCKYIFSDEKVEVITEYFKSQINLELCVER
jgi:hypothetical protein